ncbi:hypothetical protein COP2_019655 [Malus domestica]
MTAFGKTQKAENSAAVRGGRLPALHRHHCRQLYRAPPLISHGFKPAETRNSTKSPSASKRALEFSASVDPIQARRIMFKSKIERCCFASEEEER